MGDFLGEAISSCDSIDMLRRGLRRIEDKIRELESEYQNDDEPEEEGDCDVCEHLELNSDVEPCRSCGIGSNFCKKII